MPGLPAKRTELAAARWPAFFVAINEATQVMTVTLEVSSATPVKTISPKYFEI
jgi:hypothetical protein